jgi:hypothetical protein
MLYPINALRNLALESAATEIIFLVDVDQQPCEGFQEYYNNDQRYK